MAAIFNVRLAESERVLGETNALRALTRLHGFQLTVVELKNLVISGRLLMALVDVVYGIYEHLILYELNLSTCRLARPFNGIRQSWLRLGASGRISRLHLCDTPLSQVELTMLCRGLKTDTTLRYVKYTDLTTSDRDLFIITRSLKSTKSSLLERVVLKTGQRASQYGMFFLAHFCKRDLVEVEYLIQNIQYESKVLNKLLGSLFRAKRAKLWLFGYRNYLKQTYMD